jgi:hypothetical protein
MWFVAKFGWSASKGLGTAVSSMRIFILWCLIPFVNLLDELSLASDGCPLHNLADKKTQLCKKNTMRDLRFRV